MRYAVISKGLTISQLQDEVKRHGGRNLKIAIASKQVFCDLDDDGLVKLKQEQGLTVKNIQTITTRQLISAPEITPPPAAIGAPIYGTARAGVMSRLFAARHAFTPPITGADYNIAILDSGIRSSHHGLKEKVVYEKNFTSSPTLDDIFNHGTATAWVAAGGRDVEGEEAGLAPGARLFNVKVLDDTGEGTTESVVLAIEEMIKLRKEHTAIGDPLRPGCLNLSFGTEDTGDPDDPMRIACRAASELGMGITAAAGNSGPTPGTIMSPACDERVAAVGSLSLDPFAISEFSSRGPTKEGLIKPDVVFYGENLLLASSVDDESFIIKSGTSFSAPFIAGLLACAQEVAFKVVGVTEVWGWEEWIAYAPYISVKPEGAVTGKDNDYGFGMPQGDLLMRQFQPTLAMGIPDLTPLISIMMLGMLVPMFKGLK